METVKTKHTPKPWNLKPTSDGKAILINGGMVGEVHSDDIDYDEAQANANLISAAPELLEALEALVKANPGDNNWNYAAAFAAAFFYP